MTDVAAPTFVAEERRAAEALLAPVRPAVLGPPRRMAQHALCALVLLGATVVGALSPSTALLAMAAWAIALPPPHPSDPWARAVDGRLTSLRPAARAGVRVALAGAVAAQLPASPIGPGEALAVAATLFVAAAVAAVGAETGRPAPNLWLAGDRSQLRSLKAALPRIGRERVLSLPVGDEDGLVLDDIPTLLGDTVPDAVVVAPGPTATAEDLRRLQWRLEDLGIPLYIAPGLLDVGTGRLHATTADRIPLLRVEPARRDGLVVGALDLAGRVAAVLALVVLLPTLLLLAWLVRRDSPGPALFRQERIGRGGRSFTMYKFRTMAVTAAPMALTNDCDGVLFKMRTDPRVTRIGALLRRYSLDELPQLMNVVRGDMTLVGPRPALPAEVAAYDVDARRRLTVKPGLTGLWQVSGRSDLSWSESVSLDVHYVDNWSPWLDLRILLRTIPAVLGHRGAY